MILKVGQRIQQKSLTGEWGNKGTVIESWHGECRVKWDHGQTYKWYVDERYLDFQLIDDDQDWWEDAI